MSFLVHGGAAMEKLNKDEAEKLRLDMLNLIELYPSKELLKMFLYFWMGSCLIVKSTKTKNRFFRNVYLRLLQLGSKWYANRYY